MGETLTGCGCSACEASLELVWKPQVQHQVYSPAPLTNKNDIWYCPNATCMVTLPACEHSHSLWLTRCWQCHQLISHPILSNNHNFAQIPVAIRLLFLELRVGLIIQELTDWIASLLPVPKKLLLSFEFIGKFAKPPVTFFYIFVFTSAYPCLWRSWNCCQTSQVCIFPFVPSQSENVVAWQHNAKHSFSDTEQFS